jgi:hypothetical protein
MRIEVERNGRIYSAWAKPPIVTLFGTPIHLPRAVRITSIKEIKAAIGASAGYVFVHWLAPLVASEPSDHRQKSGVSS